MASNPCCWALTKGRLRFAGKLGTGFSNRDRVIFPESGITKGQPADVTEMVVPIMLPWAGGRPISLVGSPRQCAQACAPIAVPLTWQELHMLDPASHWHLEDAAEMMRRAGSKDYAHWGFADHILPDL